MSIRILIVDDDYETLRLVGIMLQNQGYEIIAANNGAQALELAIKEQPDLIILDIMMPKMDGYEVARRLRAEPLTEQIPIMLFTAKTQVDDKIAGYNAGADDYMTKPVHPAELIAHIKALLARVTPRTTEPEIPTEKGLLIGVLGSKGGLGTSTLTLNLAISLAQKSSMDIVAVELRPGNGSWALELDLKKPNGLHNSLSTKPEMLTKDYLEKQLLKTTYGPHLLLASNTFENVKLVSATENMQKLLHLLPQVSDVTLVDFGAPSLPDLDKLLVACDELILIMEPFPSCMEHTRNILQELEVLGFGKSKLINLIILNRVRADLQLSVTQIQEALKIKVTQMIPPAPEIAYFASQKFIPLIELQPEGFVTQQFQHLADIFLERLRK